MLLQAPTGGLTPHCEPSKLKPLWRELRGRNVHPTAHGLRHSTRLRYSKLATCDLAIIALSLSHTAVADAEPLHPGFHIEVSILILRSDSQSPPHSHRRPTWPNLSPPPSRSPRSVASSIARTSYAPRIRPLPRRYPTGVCQIDSLRPLFDPSLLGNPNSY